ncbi:hypothetical protein SynSYN20_01593 [Synechococcus sp. SYN20]|nr:hypothetical protein SynSYN20_01593 [Synechococcus sp. SYN20]
MADFTYDQDLHIVINKKVYARADFTPEAVQGVSVINFADQTLASKAQELNILQRGRDTLVRDLVEMMAPFPVLHEISDEEEERGEVD